MTLANFKNHWPYEPCKKFRPNKSLTIIENEEGGMGENINLMERERPEKNNTKYMDVGDHNGRDTTSPINADSI